MGSVHFLSALLLGLIILLPRKSKLSLAFSTQQKQQNRPSHRLSSLPPPTPKDEATEQLYDRQGILTGEMKLRTTQKSVAGRGVFLDTDADQKNMGDILAYVPWRVVLSQSTAASQYPDLHKRLSGSDDNSVAEKLEWPITLAAYARHVLEGTNNQNFWSHFIKGWEGGHPRFLTRRPEDYGEEELQSLAEQARSSPDKVRKLLEVRWIDYRRQTKILREALQQQHDKVEDGGGDNPTSSPYQIIPSNLYEAVLSRVISLTEFLENGDKKRHHCVVPFHDMINHNNDVTKNNVALYSVAAIRHMAPVDLDQMNADVELDLKALDERDLCVVAIQPISPGEEVFNSYDYEDQGRLTEERRVWKLLQYGFPME